MLPHPIINSPITLQKRITINDATAIVGTAGNSSSSSSTVFGLMKEATSTRRPSSSARTRPAGAQQQMPRRTQPPSPFVASSAANNKLPSRMENFLFPSDHGTLRFYGQNSLIGPSDCVTLHALLARCMTQFLDFLFQIPVLLFHYHFGAFGISYYSFLKNPASSSHHPRSSDTKFHPFSKILVLLLLFIV